MKHYNEYKYVLINENIQSTANHIAKIVEYHNIIKHNQIKLKKNLNKIINS